jgi:hypothetical protein
MYPSLFISPGNGVIFFKNVPSCFYITYESGYVLICTFLFLYHLGIGVCFDMYLALFISPRNRGIFLKNVRSSFYLTLESGYLFKCILLLLFLYHLGIGVSFLKLASRSLFFKRGFFILHSVFLQLLKNVPSSFYHL